jgi:hypothetical protein
MARTSRPLAFCNVVLVSGILVAMIASLALSQWSTTTVQGTAVRQSLVGGRAVLCLAFVDRHLLFCVDCRKWP